MPCPDMISSDWVPYGDRATIGQRQSGESGKTCNLAQSGTLQSGNLAFGWIGPIGQDRQSGEAIGQIGQSVKSCNRASHVNFLWRACPDCALCQTWQITRFARLARLLNWPDYSIAREAVFYQIADSQIAPDCYLPIGPIGQSGA